MQENGLPDFDDLRRLLARLSEHAKRKEISAFHVLCGESLTDGILSMNGYFKAHLTATSIVTEGALPLAILLESDAFLPATEIGFTVPMTLDPTDTSVESFLPTSSLIWSDRVEVLLLHKENDNDAKALAQLLSEYGCRVHSFSDSPEDVPSLSRHLLGTHCLIICKKVHLPESDYLQFALETMRRAGGVCISLETENEHAQGFLHIPNGLDESILQKICQIGNKNEKKY